MRQTPGWFWFTQFTVVALVSPTREATEVASQLTSVPFVPKMIESPAKSTTEELRAETP